MLIPSYLSRISLLSPSLSRRVNANSQRNDGFEAPRTKLIKKGEC